MFALSPVSDNCLSRERAVFLFISRSLPALAFCATKTLILSTTLFTPKLPSAWEFWVLWFFFQVSQRTEQPGRNQWVPQPHIPGALGLLIPDHHFCQKRRQDSKNNLGGGGRAGMGAERLAQNSASAQLSRGEEARPLCPWFPWSSGD